MAKQNTPEYTPREHGLEAFGPKLSQDSSPERDGFREHSPALAGRREGRSDGGIANALLYYPDDSFGPFFLKPK
jgi:hypothetical protein